MTDSTALTAFAHQLCARICNAARTFDELRVVDDLLSGLERGAEVYGPLDLASDGRDFREEAAQEARDLLVYVSAENVARQHRRRERIACHAHDELHGRVELGLRELVAFEMEGE